jgi:hypothetical protein
MPPATPTAEGHEIRDGDIAWLSPLKQRDLSVLGHYSFTLDEDGVSLAYLDSIRPIGPESLVSASRAVCQAESPG